MHSPEAISNEQRVTEAAAWIRAQGIESPAAGVILGTGLGRLAEAVADARVLDYDDIPHFPRSTAPGHRGRLHCGRLANVPVVCMQGRFHAYEGYAPAETAFPVHVMRALGAELLLVSNAAGGMNPYFRAGDVMIATDHLNMMGGGLRLLNPVSDEPCAVCPPRSVSPYNAELVEEALAVARRAGFTARRGIYIAVRGPNFETRAEYRFFRRLGGDVVGMSTVPEVLAAARLGMRVLALSTVTNVCLPDALRPTSGEAVIAEADGAAEKVRHIMLGILSRQAASRPSQPLCPVAGH